MKNRLIIFITLILVLIGCANNAVNDVKSINNDWHDNTLNLIKMSQTSELFHDFSILFYDDIHATLDDTWKALNIYNMLGISIPNKGEVVNFLENYPIEELRDYLMVRSALNFLGKDFKMETFENEINTFKYFYKKDDIDKNIIIENLYNIIYFTEADYYLNHSMLIDLVKSDNINKAENIEYVLLISYLDKKLNLGLDWSKSLYINKLEEEMSLKNPDLIKVYFLSKININIGNVIEEELVKTLINNTILEDGTFSLSKMEPSSIFATYIITDILNDLNLLKYVDEKKISTFLFGHQSDSGGFGIRKKLRPSIEASLITKYILFLLNQPSTLSEIEIKNGLLKDNIINWRMKYIYVKLMKGLNRFIVKSNATNK